MSLLSRVAERIYWAARYLERAHTTSRLARVYGNLLLDLPRESGLKWDMLVEIMGNRPLFDDLYPQPGADSAERFMVSDRNNPSSILSSLALARENVRTARDIVPSEAWRSINQLYLFAAGELAAGAAPRRRHEIHTRIVERCQQLNGLLSESMSHGPAYQYFKIGRTLERAEMTTRIIDVAAATLLAGREELVRFDNTLWMAVLQSVSAYQMYRQHVRRRIIGSDVIDFLLKDRQFPRAFTFCLISLGVSLGRLPRHEQAVQRAAGLRRDVDALDLERLDLAALHSWIDHAQTDIGALHGDIHDAWFAPALNPGRP
jgi:uncharacterized alpha-E superfamily protein